MPLAPCPAWRRRLTTAAALLAALSAAPRAVAQQDGSPLEVRALWPGERFLGGRSVLELALSRPPGAGERIALVIGTTDVSAALETQGMRIRYRPAAWRLPPGESEVVAYVVSAQGEWREAGRSPLRVQSRAGLERSRLVPTADLASTGQLDQRAAPGDPPPLRRRYQDLTLRLGLEGAAARSGWEVGLHANALAVTQEAQRLRWGERQLDAPAVDLADYRIQVSRAGARLALGGVAAGSNRHLLNGFGSRGLLAGLQLWPGAELEAAMVNGSSVVGWTNLLGLAEPAHRLTTATLRLEVLPARPGAVRIEVSGLDGSLLPRSGFTRAAVTDAEESRGAGLQVAVSDARQRIRFAGGVTRSRFTNPADPLLFGDTAVVAVRPEARTARHAELGLQLLQGARIAAGTAASLAATLRHERVDPLYRSVGAWVQSDLDHNSVDLTGSVGGLSLQASLSGARDNLSGIPSILTTRTRARSLGIAAPLGQLLGAPATSWLWPLATWSWQRTHQFGEGVPENGDFAPSHVPDQRSTAQSASLAWSPGTWSLTWRWNRSFQDNRQPGREQADFRAVVHALSLGLPAWGGVSASVDASLERQTSVEARTTQRTERLGASAQAPLSRSTAFSGALSQAWGSDPFARQRTRNTELQAELSQGLNLYRRLDGGTQARVFLRYSRTRAAAYPLLPLVPQPPRLFWSLNAGASIRLY